MRLAIVVLAGFCLTWGSDAAAQTLTGSARVIDGDTIDLEGTRVRFHGLDAAEADQWCAGPRGVWPCGEDTSKALASRLSGQTVRCEQTDTDSEGRVVAICYVDGADLNAWLVREGWAAAYTRYSSAYLDQEAQARNARRGIWSGEFVQPEAYRRGRITAVSYEPEPSQANAAPPRPPIDPP